MPTSRPTVITGGNRAETDLYYRLWFLQPQLKLPVCMGPGDATWTPTLAVRLRARPCGVPRLVGLAHWNIERWRSCLLGANNRHLFRSFLTFSHALQTEVKAADFEHAACMFPTYFLGLHTGRKKGLVTKTESRTMRQEQFHFGEAYVLRLRKVLHFSGCLDRTAETTAISSSYTKSVQPPLIYTCLMQ